MPELATYIEHHFAIYLALCFGWVLAVAIASAIFRRSKGKPIWITAPANALFVERWTSGRSLRNIITKIGGARNCLLVAVTRDILFVHPHFPFSLLFLPEIYGLDWSVPRSAIRSVQSIPGILGERVRIEFEDLSGSIARVELRLRASQKFRDTLEM